MRTRNTAKLMALSVAFLSHEGMSAELSGTLKKVKESGTITLAYRDATIPFSYLADASGVPVGYSQDIQSKVVEVLKKELDLPNLKIQYNLVTSQTRIPLINGTVDIECGSTTNNAERQQQVSFSVGTFEISTRLLIAKQSSYNDINDLKGRNVVTTIKANLA